VSGLAHPDFPIEMHAIAVVTDERETNMVDD